MGGSPPALHIAASQHCGSPLLFLRQMRNVACGSAEVGYREACLAELAETT